MAKEQNKKQIAIYLNEDELEIFKEYIDREYKFDTPPKALKKLVLKIIEDEKSKNLFRNAN